MYSHMYKGLKSPDEAQILGFLSGFLQQYEIHIGLRELQLEKDLYPEYYLLDNV